MILACVAVERNIKSAVGRRNRKLGLNYGMGNI